LMKRMMISPVHDLTSTSASQYCCASAPSSRSARQAPNRGRCQWGKRRRHPVRGGAVDAASSAKQASATRDRRENGGGDMCSIAIILASTVSDDLQSVRFAGLLC
jgi:hypothetical protein